MTNYYQCKLRRGDSEKTAWIPARGAYKGKSVELLPSKEFWEVVEVGNCMPEDMLRQHQKDHRKSFASIESIQ